MDAGEYRPGEDRAARDTPAGPRSPEPGRPGPRGARQLMFLPSLPGQETPLAPLGRRDDELGPVKDDHCRVE
jgi:hypothetical protein